MKLQVAFDYFSLDEALPILDEINEYIDIAEIGTPLVLFGGVDGVKQIRRRYPGLTILADTKIMDGGYAEAKMMFDAGADIVSVMAVSNDPTIAGVARAAKECGKQSFVDMMCVENLPGRAAEVHALGADYLCVHTAYDVQGTQGSPLAGLEELRKAVPDAKTAIAGGVNPSTAPAVVKLGAEILIVGGAVVNAADKVGMVQTLRNIMNG